MGTAGAGLDPAATQISDEALLAGAATQPGSPRYSRYRATDIDTDSGDLCGVRSGPPHGRAQQQALVGSASARPGSLQPIVRHARNEGSELMVTYVDARGSEADAGRVSRAQ
eukprot:12882161-Alexandrium_andersonii.AAC.1